MKEHVLIIGGDRTENTTAEKHLCNAGIKGTENMARFFEIDGYCTLGWYKYVARSVETDGKDYTVFFAREITADIASKLPGAKQLPPTGPWEFEGRMWEIDGDEKREVRAGEVCISESNKPGVPIKAAWNFQPSELRWILRPLITAELQAATEAVEETRAKLNRLRTAHNNSKTDLMIANRDHKRNLDEVKCLSGK